MQQQKQTKETMQDMKQAELVTVVIPYFQRDAGLLRKCVTSILAQQGVERLHVIVVDDASPLPATDELQGIWEVDSRVTVIRQDNAGPGAARNRGLDNLPDGTCYVAFIDSDDWWETDFLQTALAAFGRGNDVFFANTARVGFEDSRFDWEAHKKLNLDVSQHELIDNDLELYRFKGNFFEYALVRSNIISSSALVYRRDCSPLLRFNPQLFNGEDRLFKLQLCQYTNKVAFSPRILVQEGTGVNIFDSAGWGTSESLARLCNYIELSKYILNEMSLNSLQRKVIRSQLGECRYSLLASVVHLLKSRTPFDWVPVRAAIKTDPALLLYSFPNLLRILLSRTAKRTS